MISFEEAYGIVLGAVRPLPAEPVDLSEAYHRILAEEVRADVAMPPFDKAVVDGFTCRREDLHRELALVETIAAGYEPHQKIGPGECAKIMTGAMIPEGADCVFMVEHSRQDEAGSVKFTKDDTADNIVPMGTDVRPGDLVLSPGKRLGAPDIAILASMGCVRPKVARRPDTAILATGDELVEPSQRPGISQIRNSNGYQLAAQVYAAGATVSTQGVARDTEASLQQTISGAIAQSDVLILSGGVSMGEFDLVPGVLKQFGIALQFEKVAIQPGKPTVFGYSDSVFCFGLPGNPVSTFTIFELLVKPFLLAMMGHTHSPPSVAAPLEAAFTRRNATRKAWVPVRLTEEGKVAGVEYHGSAHVNALCHADGLIAFPEGVDRLAEGTSVSVRLIRD